jgi:Txe/YoeB family toxin of Txe-Axe toxin-antitoxin module
VVFADRKLKETFERLKDSTAEDRKLHKWLNRSFDEIAIDAFRGIQIPKRLIPGKYIEQYGIENLWKYNLPGAWRLLYSVARDEVVVVSIILEWLPHKDYEKRFGY